VRITNRSKDVVRSDVEWISCIEIENLAVGHPTAYEGAEIGIPHPNWDERPLLIVKLKPDTHAPEGELLC